ncbi:hypothetical protein GCM10010411_52650 [Actinomadura fulvescens]|uniref:Uncharacterized protein n=1 Tax=Actinomadura fulvescens TaxID=46160 RepID=A0ABN3Q4T4_9ACTN
MIRSFVTTVENDAARPGPEVTETEGGRPVRGTTVTWSPVTRVTVRGGAPAGAAVASGGTGGSATAVPAPDTVAAAITAIEAQVHRNAALPRTALTTVATPLPTAPANSGTVRQFDAR